MPDISSGSPSALDTLEQQASATTNAAVSQGKRDVEAVKATGAAYYDQAKQLATSALNAANVCKLEALIKDLITSKSLAHIVLSHGREQVQCRTKSRRCSVGN